MSESVNVQIIFTRVHETHGTYRDALYLPKEVWDLLLPAEVTAIEDDRFAAWVERIENPPAAPPATPVRVFTKFGFRSLLTLDELIAIDNYDITLPAEAVEAKMAMRTIMLNFSVADEIDLDDAATATGLYAIESFGLLAEGRAAEILATGA